MTICSFCHKKIENLSYKCNYCGKLHCSVHRLPQIHNCSKIDSNKLEYLKQDLPIYTPFVSDFDELTLDSIYERTISKKLLKPEALKYLKIFLEESEDIETKINTIIAFDALELNSDEAFKILENCLVNEKDLEVQETVASILRRFFPKKRIRYFSLRYGLLLFVSNDTHVYRGFFYSIQIK